MNPAKFFEYSRFLIIIVGTFLGFYLYHQQPVTLLHFMMPVIVLSLSGLTGIEGLFFSQSAAISLGRKTNSPYQKQSAMNNLSVAIVGFIVWLANWGKFADAALMLCTLTFITLSACVHTWEFFALGNRNPKNMLRGVWTI